MSIAFALLIGLLIGLIVGALGAGGGILSVPALVYLLNQPPHEAAVGSLIIVGSTSLISLIPRAFEHKVRWRDGLIFGVLSTAATYLGSRLSLLVDEELIMLLLGVLLALVGVVLLANQRKNERKAEKSGGKVNIPVLIACASFTGLLTGFFGVGGGFVVVPMLMLAMKFDVRYASGTSLLVMAISSATGLVSRIGADLSIDWPVIIGFAVASMIGGLIGAPASRRFSEKALTSAFAVLLLAVSAATLIQVAT